MRGSQKWLSFFVHKKFVNNFKHFIKNACVLHKNMLLYICKREIERWWTMKRKLSRKEKERRRKKEDLKQVLEIIKLLAEIILAILTILTILIKGLFK